MNDSIHFDIVLDSLPESLDEYDTCSVQKCTHELYKTRGSFYFPLQNIVPFWNLDWQLSTDYDDDTNGCRNGCYLPPRILQEIAKELNVSVNAMELNEAVDQIYDKTNYKIVHAVTFQDIMAFAETENITFWYYALTEETSKRLQNKVELKQDPLFRQKPHFSLLEDALFNAELQGRDQIQTVAMVCVVNQKCFLLNVITFQFDFHNTALITNFEDFKAKMRKNNLKYNFNIWLKMNEIQYQHQAEVIKESNVSFLSSHKSIAVGAKVLILSCFLEYEMCKNHIGTVKKIRRKGHGHVRFFIEFENATISNQIMKVNRQKKLFKGQKLSWYSCPVHHLVRM